MTDSKQIAYALDLENEYGFNEVHAAVVEALERLYPLQIQAEKTGRRWFGITPA